MPGMRRVQPPAPGAAAQQRPPIAQGFQRLDLDACPAEVGINHQMQISVKTLKVFDTAKKMY